ncbi:cell cycle checkpoint control protein RAD9B [Cololabis saira]|uniref:cell cycle checkpoint control protein RAD9B n=1 Tax=Cololabis saira TaxID=129043 RepID=UPI002AD2B669|nr:cell cycle checkpoint control protein RAD9B [Cololabis saira]
MDCIMESKGVKVFGKALYALSRVGDELWLDPTVKGLALRSVNSAHSAYAGFLFSPLFFQQYRMESQIQQGNEPLKCKLLMKSVLPLFRCLTSIERNVKRCQISASFTSDKVIIQFFCRHGITKTYNIHFQESEALQAVFAPHLCPNILKAPARLLADMVMHFPVYQEEITLSMTAVRVSLRNYCEEGKGHLKMHTEMSLHPDEFDYFQIGALLDITFCLKELRGFLSFAEAHSLSVLVHFGAAGQPVCFSVEDTVLEANVVLATTNDSGSSDSPQPAETPAPTSSRCADPAAVDAGVSEGDGNTPLDIPDIIELVTSSQGSPIINPPSMIHLLPPTDDFRRLFVPNEECASAAASPAPTTIWSLLFKALSSEQESEDGRAAGLPVLACYTDEEESMEDET